MERTNNSVELMQKTGDKLCICCAVMCLFFSFVWIPWHLHKDPFVNVMNCRCRVLRLYTVSLRIEEL